MLLNPPDGVTLNLAVADYLETGGRQTDQSRSSALFFSSFLCYLLFTFLSSELIEWKTYSVLSVGAFFLGSMVGLLSVVNMGKRLSCV